MKKLTLAFITLLTTTTLSAQDKPAQFGAKGGMNLATIRIRNSPSRRNIVAYHAGAMAQINVSDDFAVQAELVYSKQGTRAKTFTTQTPYDEKLSYINVPVLAQFKSGSGFRLYGGPQFGFLLNAKTTQPGVDLDKTYYYKKFDFAFAVGCSHQTNSGFGADARVNVSLLNTADVEGANLRNLVWQFGVFYVIK